MPCSGVGTKIRLTSTASAFSAHVQLPSRSSKGSRRSARRVECRSTSGGPEEPSQNNLLQQFRSEATRFSERYDILSTGAGAMVCTTFFWSRGQDPMTALYITVCATAIALIVNEVMFGNEQ